MTFLKNPASWFCVCLVVWLSCDRQSPHELLIGNWKMVVDTLEQTPPPPPSDIGGRGVYYEFINDSIVDTKRRYYKVTRSTTGDRQYKFIGTTTKYKIIQDSLKFFNLTDSAWQNVGLLKSVTNDRLTLVNIGGKESLFLRQPFRKSSTTNIDAIALSSSGCYGTCPIINIIVESDGDVTFYGERYIDKIGFFEGQLPEETFERISNEFNKAEIEKLKQDYSVRHSDDETISTTFVFKKRFINSIEDYGEAGPDELVWGYTALRYLFHELDLIKLDSAKVPFYLDLHYFSFEKGKEVCPLTQSESFLLWNYLRKGLLVQHQANPKYALKFVRNYIWFPSHTEMEDPYNKMVEEKVNSIATDGQFYTIDIIGQKPITIDIGFNFFDVNQKFFTFRERGEYD